MRRLVIIILIIMAFLWLFLRKHRNIDLKEVFDYETIPKNAIENTYK